MDDIKKAAQLIRDGKVVAFPTETVYGLGANALDPLAVARIFELKERPAFDPLIVHVSDMEQLYGLTPDRDPRIALLAETFWPGPLTLVLEKSSHVPDIVTSGLPTVGLRIPDHPVARELIRRAGCPVAAPSANKFGRISPTEAWHVSKNLPEADYVLDGGPTRVGIESTIIGLRPDGFVILRPGGITREDLLAILPESSEAPAPGSPEAPGMLASHYSPAKPFYLFSEDLADRIDPSRAGYIRFSGEVPLPFARVISPTQNADLREYATRIFGAMHELEASDVAVLVAQPVPAAGIGIAIMDRLRKAAHDWETGVK